MQEPQYRSVNKRIRPFAQSAGVSARGCSRRLQRTLTDLGADLPYAQAMDKMVEHYGIVIAESAIRRITLEHAQTIQQRSRGLPQGLPKGVSPGQTFITQGLGSLLNELQAHLEPAQTPDEDAPVRQCWRYLSQRQDQLDYEGAISQGLPIGSGEIESAHRYVVQKRLKLPGAWWTAANAENMLALRVNRANGEWQGYWATNYRYAA